jgi:ABC-type amino acid transport substrate-binding protein
MGRFAGMRRGGTIGVLAALVALASLAAGCNGFAPKALKPKVAPPVIGKAGVLRAVIDLSMPPFGGTDKGKRAGLDIDVASAVAERLGLKLEIVDATPTVGAKLLADGKADVMLGGIRIDQAVSADVAFAGPYLNDAPAVFSAFEATHTLQSIAGMRIAAQQGSQAYWMIADEYGDDSVVGYPTLEKAFKSVEDGQADILVGDGVVGTYMLRQHPTLKLNGQLAPAVPVGITVSKTATDLEMAVRDALDGLSSSGVLETLRRKWLGDTPRFVGSTDASASLETTEVAP